MLGIFLNEGNKDGEIVQENQAEATKKASSQNT